jgi:hypothetical protein
MFLNPTNPLRLAQAVIPISRVARPLPCDQRQGLRNESNFSGYVRYYEGKTEGNEVRKKRLEEKVDGRKN